MNDNATDQPEVDLVAVFPDDGRPDNLTLHNSFDTLADPVESWGSEELRAAVDGGTATHWRRIAQAILTDPLGKVAETIELDTMWTSARFGQRATPDPDTFHVTEVLIGLIQTARRSETVHELTPDMTGVWIVRTQGSSHIGDLDAMTYERCPGPKSRAGAFELDRMPQPITRVDIWPKTLSYFKVWFDDPNDPIFMEQFRQSSLIRMIQPYKPD